MTNKSALCNRKSITKTEKAKHTSSTTRRKGFTFFCASIGEECFIGAGCIVSSHIMIAAKVTLGAGAIAMKNIDIEGSNYIGMPARVIPQHDRMNGVPKKR